MSNLTDLPVSPAQMPPPAVPHVPPPDARPGGGPRRRAWPVVVALTAVLAIGLFLVVIIDGRSDGPDREAARLVADAFAAIDDGRLDSAITDATSVIALQPGDEDVLASAYVARSVGHALRGDYVDAEIDATAAIELKPSKSLLVRALLARSEAEYVQLLTDQALDDATAAIELEPEDPDLLALAYAGRSRVYVLQGDLEAAADDASRSIDLGDDPTALAWAHVVLSQVYTAQGAVESASTEARAALDLDPRDTNVIALANMTLSVSHHLSGRFDQAIVDATSAIEIRPVNREVLARAHLLRCLSYAELERWNEVVADATQAIDLEPNDWMTLPYALMTRGRALAELGRIADAASDFEAAMVVDPYASDQIRELAEELGIELVAPLHSGLATGETSLLAGYLAPIDGYVYEDVASFETDAMMDWIIRLESEMGVDLLAGFSLHCVVADDPTLNTASEAELAFLQLFEFTDNAPLELREQLIEENTRGNRIDTIELAARDVLVFEDPTSVDSRYSFTWLDGHVAGILDGADRNSIEQWLNLYLAKIDMPE